MVTDILVISAFFLMLLCPCLVGLHASLAEEALVEEDTKRAPWAPMRGIRTALSGLSQLRIPSAGGFLLGCALGVVGTLVALHPHPAAHGKSLQALRLSETALWLTDNVGSGWAR